MAEGNGSVSYTVKELLAKLDGKLDGVIVALGAKADKHDLDNLRADVEQLKLKSAGSSAVALWARWTVTLATSGLVAALVSHYLPR